jgi:hypothetical protein
MHKSATKCNETIAKWCKNKHGASKIIDTLETYQPSLVVGQPTYSLPAKNLRALEYIASKLGGLEGDELHRLQELCQVA